ncbi:hypothetical protein T484DRAFT_1859028, partial [Baffinella frigidus]
VTTAGATDAPGTTAGATDAEVSETAAEVATAGATAAPGTTAGETDSPGTTAGATDAPGTTLEDSSTTTPAEESKTTSSGAPAEATTSAESPRLATTTTMEESTTTTPPAPDFTTYVEMVVSLPFSAAEFTSDKQANFLEGVAAAAGVSVSKVEITDIREVTSRRSASLRRLLATSVEVDFRVAAGDTAAAQSIASNLDATSLNAALTQQARRPGLPEATVVKTAAVESTTTTSPSVPSPPPTTDGEEATAGATTDAEITTAGATDAPGTTAGETAAEVTTAGATTGVPGTTADAAIGSTTTPGVDGVSSTTTPTPGGDGVASTTTAGKTADPGTTAGATDAPGTTAGATDVEVTETAAEVTTAAASDAPGTTAGETAALGTTAGATDALGTSAATPTPAENSTTTPAEKIPQVVSFSPARVYADGGHTVTIYVTDFPDVQAASEVSAVATAADGTELTFDVVSIAKNAAGVTTVVFTTTAGAAGKADVVIYTSAKRALPFLLDLVAVPTGAPQVTQFEPSIGECRAGSPVNVSMRLDSFRELTDAANLQVTFGGISTIPRNVSSLMTGTTFEFSTGVEDLDGGAYKVRVWSSTNASKVAVSTFKCKDTTVATLVGAYPASGFAGSNTAVSVFLADSGYTAQDTVYLTQDGSTTALANAAKGGSPMEVILTLTSATPGASNMTLAPCVDPSVNATCLQKVVYFIFNFLDPASVRVTGFFPLSEYVTGRTKIDVTVKNLPAEVKNLPAVLAQVILNFGASNATCKSVATTTGVLTFEIPSEPTATAGVVYPRLHLLASGESFDLPKTFDYLEQKPAVITSVLPSKASIRTAATARVTVRNLPGTDAASDIAVQLVWSNVRNTSLQVLSVTRSDVRKQVYEVQEWYADVTTPVDVEEGAVTVRVIHRVFGAFVELQAGLVLYDEALPQVMSVSGPDGAGQTSANVP